MPGPRENDRYGQYGRPGNAWQPGGRTDDPSVPRAPQLADKLQGEALYGVNPVLGALQAMRRDCTTLYVQEGQSAPIHPPVSPQYGRHPSFPTKSGHPEKGHVGLSLLLLR